MSETLKALTLCAVCLGGWTLVSLLSSVQGERRLRLTLAVLVALLLLPPLQVYLSLATGQAWPVLGVLAHSLTWAYGPLLLRSVGLALLWPPGRWLHPVHGLPLLLAAGAALLGWDWASAPWAVLLLGLQSLAYATVAARAAWRERARLRQLALGHANSRAHWMLLLAGGLLIASVWDLGLFTALQWGWLPPPYLLVGGALGLALYIDSLALMTLHPPRWLDPVDTEAPADQATALAAEAPAEPMDADVAPIRIVELSPTVARELTERLQTLVAREAPHRDPEMSLPRLAALMDISPHQLSELLNLHLGSSYYDYLNQCRFEDAKSLLEAHAPELTVADIAYRAGFNNRNSFYKVFRDKTGQTPAEYRKLWARQA